MRSSDFLLSDLHFLSLQARNRSGQVGYVPEKYLQLPSSNSLLSMLQSLATLDARSHSSSNSTEPETELPSGSVNGDSSGEARLRPQSSVSRFCLIQLSSPQSRLRRRCTTTPGKPRRSSPFPKAPSSGSSAGRLTRTMASGRGSLTASSASFLRCWWRT